MTTPEKIEHQFWKALRSDRTVMLGCEGAPPRPMTGQVEGDDDHGPIWFFTSVETELGEVVGKSNKKGMMTFVDKGHSVWASAEGDLSIVGDDATIDRLWNPFVAAWFDGREDPKMRLIRFDAHEAQLWQDGSSLLAGVKMLMGSDPKADYRDKVAHVRLDD